MTSHILRCGEVLATPYATCSPRISPPLKYHFIFENLFFPNNFFSDVNMTSKCIKHSKDTDYSASIDTSFVHLASGVFKTTKNGVNNQTVPPQNDVIMKNNTCFLNQRRKSHHMRPQRKIDSKMVKERNILIFFFSKLLRLF